MVLPGATSIFDLIPDEVPEDQREAWVKLKFVEIRVNCAKYKGTAFRHYMDGLATTPRDKLVAKVRALITEFETHLGLTTRLRALHHAAMNFGLLYAGGVLAIEAGLMPVSKDRLLKSLTACFRAGADLISTPESLEREALVQLACGIQGARFRPKSELAGDRYANGFTRSKSENDARRVVVVDPPLFRSWFATYAHCEAALNILFAERRLMVTDSSCLGAGSISMETVVSFEKLRDRDGNRHNRRWIRFIDLDDSNATRNDTNDARRPLARSA